jgi:TRAP-type C4-dicarboxylate transport system substrate-binding protein
MYRHELEVPDLKKTLSRLVLTLLLITMSASIASAAVTIKLATLVPERSVWGNVLRDMGAEWKEATHGDVILRIYPGGVAGDDPDVVRKMRIGQLQAGTLTLAGLSEIDDSFSVFSIPMFFESYEEYFYVLEKLEPTLRKILAEKGFELLHWGHGGWIHLFSAEEVNSVDDLKQDKLFVWSGSDKLVRWWKDSGYHPVPLAFTDVPTGLQTGMINAMPNTPLAALSFQYFRSTPYMLEMGFGPFLGATVVTSKAWEKIDEDDRKAILASSETAAGRFRTEVPEQDAKAITEMEKRGLTITSAGDPQVQATWRAEADKFATEMRSTFVPPAIYDMASKARDDFRSRAGSN